MSNLIFVSEAGAYPRADPLALTLLAWLVNSRQGWNVYTKENVVAYCMMMQVFRLKFIELVLGAMFSNSLQA